MADQGREIHQPQAHEFQGARKGVLHPADESDREALAHGPNPRDGDSIGLPVAEELSTLATFGARLAPKT